jgi:hypothetical protein
MANQSHETKPKVEVVRVYIVRPGDTLAQISAWFCGGTSHYRSLAAANRIANPSFIEPGWRIILTCNAVPVSQPAAPAPSNSPSYHKVKPRHVVTPAPSPTPSATQPAIPASTPRPSPKHTSAVTLPPSPVSSTQAKCVIAAPGQPVIPGTYIAKYSRCGLEQLWIEAGGSKAKAAQAACIALAVSNGVTFKTSPRGNEGLWQIPPKPAGYLAFQPAANARAAVLLSKNGTNWSWIVNTGC